jgi:hypothetical protein
MRALFLAGLAVAALSCAAATAADDKKGTKVEIDGLTSTAPADWKKEELPARSMRAVQFKLPAAAGDKDDAEVIVFKLGGSAKDNVARWKAQFRPAEGKVTEFKIAGHDAVQLDITGTYAAPPFDPTYKGKRMADFRLIGIQVSPENTWQIKLLGPAKTVEKHKKDFDAWVKGFKK